MAGRRGRWSSWAVVIGLLALPAVLGVIVGWYGFNPMMAERFTPTGGYCHNLLNGFPDSHLTVEIAAPPGKLPDPSAVSLLWSRMNETIDKSSITFVESTYSASRTAYTIDDLWNLELGVRHSWPGWGSMALFYLFVPGSYTPSPSVIGLAFQGSSIAVFPDTITTNAPGQEGVSLTATVMIHEFGHELGLVGIVGSAPNQDPAHPYHSSDPNDVMYWAVDSTDILTGFLGGGFPNQFDSADFADLSTVKSTPLAGEIAPWAVLGISVAAALVLALGERRRRSPRPSAPPPAAPAKQAESGPKAICL